MACRWSAAWSMGLVLAIATPARADLPVDTAVQVLQAQGCWAQLGGVSESVQAYLLAAVDADPSANAAKRRQMAALSLALQKAFAPERLRQSVAKSVAKSLSAQDAADIRQWYAQEPGLTVVAMEGQAPTRPPEAPLTLSPDRRDLLGDVLAARGLVEVQTEVLIQSLQAIHKGTVAFMPSAAKVSDKALKQRLEAQRGSLAQGLWQAALATSGVGYAPLSNAQLAQYRDFLRSPVGQRLVMVQRQAIERALRDAVDETALQLMAGATGQQPATVPR